MKNYTALFVLLLTVVLHNSTWASCLPGVYRDAQQNVIVLSDRVDQPDAGLGFLMLDGRYGNTSSSTSKFECENNFLYLTEQDTSTTQFTALKIRRTATTFISANTQLAGELIEPVDETPNTHPLVVMVQGSESSPAIGNNRAYLLAGKGIAVFVYDKRGTGKSEGIYTQNFNLLAEDAAAALTHAHTLAADRISRAGYWGASQGGWIAPLASLSAHADFIVIGYGLVASPIEEDLDQMLMEAQEQKLDTPCVAKIRQLSKITARILKSHFENGLQDLEKLRREFKQQSCPSNINGEYSGAMLHMTDAELRKIGSALFDNLELIWDYDSAPVLQKIHQPILWIAAQNDREAPIQRTLKKLALLKQHKSVIDVYTFPNTDHGMYEYQELADGTRKKTRVTNGYFSLVASWILEVQKPFVGNAVLMN